MNPLTTQRFVNAAHDERVARYPAPSREDGYYSELRNNGTVGLFVGPNGDITAERPHVHVVHSPSENRVVFVATDRTGRHIHEETLPATASGNEVNAMVDRMRRML